MSTLTNFEVQLWTFLKRNIVLLGLGIAFLIFYFGGCHSTNTGKTVSDTTTHTVYVPQPIIVNPPYQPTQSGQTVYIPIPQSSQGVIPATTIDGLTSQVKDLSTRIEELGKQYYATKHYQDSIQLNDSSGKRVGVVNLSQTVSENTLQSTQPSYQLSFPHTTTTITNTIYVRPRTQVFLGVTTEALLNQAKVNSIGLGALLKNKKDVVFGVAGKYFLPTKSTGVEFSLYKKLAFKNPLKVITP